MEAQHTKPGHGVNSHPVEQGEEAEPERAAMKGRANECTGRKQAGLHDRRDNTVREQLAKRAG
eukprot:13583801-Heterocapsa_arctica.AAC.1